MPNLSDKLARAAIDHEIDLLRVAASANRKVQSLLTALQNDIAGRLSQSHLSAYATARLTAVLRDVRELISSAYGGIDDVMMNRLTDLAPIEAAITAGTVNNIVGISLMEGTLPKATLKLLYTDTLIMGAPSSQWWLKQAQDVTFKFAQAIRMGMAVGETNGELVARVRGIDSIFQGPRRQAEALVRTSVQTVANAARLAVMKENSDVLLGCQQLSTLDDRTTPVCQAYDLQTWDLNGKPIRGTTLPFVNEEGSEFGVPRHWGCRSVLVPLVKSWQDILGVDIGEFTPTQRASMDGAVAGKTTYEDWLGTKSEELQDAILGPGKAALWRDGKITTKDLVNQNGRPMTLTELKAKHGVAP
jgi:hypothetical protein